MEDTKTLLTQITGEGFTHIHRNANSVAYRVTKFATHIDMTLRGLAGGRGVGDSIEVNHIRSCCLIRWLSVLVDTDCFVGPTDSWLIGPCPANTVPKYGNTVGGQFPFAWKNLNSRTEATLLYLVFQHYPSSLFYFFL
ncbi:PREDICTED: PRUPE_6G203400 [Prunus dulcis]|uniref:PREDICTED: PRUPE_6G203400 n=1 Tax=Prunus dulcis TaxID=3755 RepID=A0A5E4EYB6_PRUDU|nr:PREDICTED: PRUPE_6G203400 [Prunus dulcis]